MNKTSWIKYGIYAASGVCAILAAVLPPAAIPLGIASSYLAGLATQTPGTVAVPKAVQDPPTKPIIAPKAPTLAPDASKPNPS